MPVIQDIRACSRLAGYRQVTLGCSHKMILRDDNPLLTKGAEIACDACIRGEKTIIAIKTEMGKDKYKVELSCGHIREFTYFGPVNYATVPDFFGTAQPCQICPPDQGDES